MIKARGSTSDGREFILIGLSRENCHRLLDGKPIRIDTQQPPESSLGLGIKGGPVIAIVAGETEDQLAKLIGPLVKELN